MQWLEESSFLQWRLVYLDLRYWIGMCDRADAAHIELYERLSELLEAGKIICPVSTPLIIEAQKRPRSPRRDAWYALMDTFSRGLCLRALHLVFKDEFRACYAGDVTDKRVAYASVADAFGSMKLRAPTGTWSEERLAEITHELYPKMAGMSIAEMMGDDRIAEAGTSHALKLQAAWEALCQREQDARATHTDTISALLEAEFAATTRSYMRQIIDVVMCHGTQKLDALQGLSKSKSRALLLACSAFVAEYRLVAFLRSNRKKVRPNDLWDVLHVANALPYVDCLGCDRGTRHLCEQTLPYLPSRGDSAVVVSSPQGLLDWLKRLD